VTTDILMPALSPTMEEGTLAKWHVKVGDRVKSGDIIADIETDKATMEVEAVDEGLVESLLVAEGAEGVKINTPIARLAGDGDGDVDRRAPAATASPAEGETPAIEANPQRPTSPKEAAPLETQSQAPVSSSTRIAASPLARRVAAREGLALETLTGTGPHGRIILSDVEASLTGKGANPPKAVIGAPASVPAASVSPRTSKTLEQMGIPPGSYDLAPLDGMKKTIARRMTDSFRDVPHFPLTLDIELDALLAARAQVNALAAEESRRVSVNDFIIKACASALKKVPAANASYSDAGIALHHHADIAVAVAIDGGLITPIIRSADTKGILEISLEMKDLAARARARKLRPEEFQGGTFSVSNLGMFGIKSFASIINEPQGCILSVGAGEKRAVVRGGEIATATLMTVTLTCDHRVVDGAIGARWLSAFKSMIENPIAMFI
jgi:pyruvate dehydrogenase E2 component (dihydrolipoamide acetyltransferase)